MLKWENNLLDNKCWPFTAGDDLHLVGEKRPNLRSVMGIKKLGSLGTGRCPFLDNLNMMGTLRCATEEDRKFFLCLLEQLPCSVEEQKGTMSNH